MFIRKIGVIVTISFLSSTAIAGQYESLESLTALAKGFTTKNVVLDQGEALEITVPQSELNKTLVTCANAITMDFPEGTNRDHFNAVELSCGSPVAWKILVPVNISILTKVVVAKHNIISHQVINEDDVDISSTDKSHLYSGFFTEKTMVVGQMSNQSISAGMVLTKRNIQQPTLVHRNEVIDLTAKNNSITVMMKGVARSDGGLHDMIKAYNPSSKKMLDAVVIGSGRVEVVS